MVVEWQILVRKLTPAELAEAARRKLLNAPRFPPGATSARKRAGERKPSFALHHSVHVGNERTSEGPPVNGLSSGAPTYNSTLAK